MRNPLVWAALLALLFSVGSFWWMHWRRGKLRVSAPRSYAVVGQKDRLYILAPFVFYNDGAAPIIVETLRRIIDNQVDRPLTFQATLTKLGTSEGRGFAFQFPVPGRQAVSLICEFQRQPGGRRTRSCWTAR
jgi:hypothetical protein